MLPLNRMSQLVMLPAIAVAYCGLALAQTTDAHSSRWHQRQGATYLDQHNLARALDEFCSAVRLVGSARFGEGDTQIVARRGIGPNRPGGCRISKVHGAFRFFCSGTLPSGACL